MLQSVPIDGNHTILSVRGPNPRAIECPKLPSGPPGTVLQTSMFMAVYLRTEHSQDQYRFSRFRCMCGSVMCLCGLCSNVSVSFAFSSMYIRRAWRRTLEHGLATNA